MPDANAEAYPRLYGRTASQLMRIIPELKECCNDDVGDVTPEMHAEARTCSTSETLGFGAQHKTPRGDRQ